MKKDAQKVKIIIRKKKNSHHEGSHGGSWKIAYADFMTAMMALFLVMWLIGKSTTDELKGIAEYFRTPISIAFSGGPKASNSESPIPGGGDDFTKEDGEEKLAELPENSIEQQEKQREVARLRDVGKKVIEMFLLDPRLKALKPNIIVELTEMGLRIQILASNNQPMFDVGSAKIQPNMQEILHAIAPIINTLSNKIVLSGHTDERQYPSGDSGYSNWELSADRANASRIELITGGLDKNKIIRVTALADTVGLNNPKYSADANRRISILILNNAAQKYIEDENIMTGIDLLNLVEDEESTEASNDETKVENDEIETDSLQNHQNSPAESVGQMQTTD